MANTFGKIFKLTTFGESHGKAIGGIIDGCPSGLDLNLSTIQKQLNRRRPGQSMITSQRNETDKLEVLSGIFNKKTTGAPIGFIIRNNNHKSQDYNYLKNTFRPSHADFTYEKKYGLRDYRGGGRSSARETACRIVGGSVAQQILSKFGVNVFAYVSQIGDVKLDKLYSEIDFSQIDSNIVRCPDNKCAKKMITLVNNIKKNQNTIGGEIFVVAKGVQIGLGEPIFNKLQADLAKAMLSINAVHAFKYGFEVVNISSSKGSEVNDVFTNIDGKTLTNFSGGIQGGISNGNDIYCSVAFKPVSTIMKKQKSIDKQGKKIEINNIGRHDPCVVPRAVPIVESMMALTLVDHLLIKRTNRL